jgi:hypothetical protein
MPAPGNHEYQKDPTAAGEHRVRRRPPVESATLGAERDSPSA